MIKSSQRMEKANSSFWEVSTLLHRKKQLSNSLRLQLKKKQLFYSNQLVEQLNSVVKRLRWSRLKQLQLPALEDYSLLQPNLLLKVCSQRMRLLNSTSLRKRNPNLLFHQDLDPHLLRRLPNPNRRVYSDKLNRHPVSLVVNLPVVLFLEIRSQHQQLDYSVTLLQPQVVDYLVPL